MKARRGTLAALGRPGGMGASKRALPRRRCSPISNAWGNLEDPGLDFGMCDLATRLPAGPILLRGRLRTALAREGRRSSAPTSDRESC